MGEDSGAVSDRLAATRGTQNAMLLQAVSVLRTRCEKGTGYADLSPAGAADLGDTLAGIAAAGNDVKGLDRAEAMALAHRLLDDDHPELSPMWPRPTG